MREHTQVCTAFDSKDVCYWLCGPCRKGRSQRTWAHVHAHNVLSSKIEVHTYACGWLCAPCKLMLSWGAHKYRQKHLCTCAGMSVCACKYWQRHLCTCAGMSVCACKYWQKHLCTCAGMSVCACKYWQKHLHVRGHERLCMQGLKVHACQRKSARHSKRALTVCRQVCLPKAGGQVAAGALAAVNAVIPCQRQPNY